MNRKMLIVLVVLGAIVVTTILFLKQPTKTMTIGEYEAKPHIAMTLDAIKIAIASSPDDKIHVQMKGHKLKDSIVTITEENDRFFITENRSKEKWLENIYFRSTPTIIVQLPKSQSETLTLNTTDGDVTIQNLTLDTFQVKTAAGFVNLNNISTSTTELRTIDGTVTITKSAIDNLSVTTSAGDVAIRESTGSVHTIQTTDGQIKMTETTEQPNLHVKSISGDIGIHYKTTPTSLQVTTTGENITNTLPKFDNKISTTHNGANTLLAETKYGVIVIK